MFEDAFARCPKLLLQNLHRRNMEAYINLRFNQSDQFRMPQTLEPISAPFLVSELVDIVWSLSLATACYSVLTGNSRTKVRIDTFPSGKGARGCPFYYFGIESRLDNFR